jgi:hypothetical protein
MAQSQRAFLLNILLLPITDALAERRSEELRAHIEEIKKEINGISHDIKSLKEQGVRLFLTPAHLRD